MAVVFAMAGLAIGGIGAAASASTGNDHEVATITMQSRLVSSTTNSAGLGGPGDVLANLNVFTTSTGASGHADITCQIFPNSEQECVGSFVFPNGSIDASAAIRLPLTSFTAPITGGSGAYQGVGGQIDNVLVSPGVTNRTFHLIYPQQ
jgi:hypothetical protein